MFEWVYQIPPKYQWFTMNPSFPLIIESTTLASTLLFFFKLIRITLPLIILLSVVFVGLKGRVILQSHVTVKLSLASGESFCFNKDNLPRVVHSACLGDCLPALCVWIKIEVYPKKKKKSIENELELVGNFKLMFKFMPKFWLQ